MFYFFIFFVIICIFVHRCVKFWNNSLLKNILFVRVLMSFFDFNFLNISLVIDSYRVFFKQNLLKNT